MGKLNPVGLLDALECINERFSTYNIACEEVFLKDALNRISAEDCFSPLDVPSFKRSTVDGYAVRFEDVAFLTNGDKVALKLLGEVEMGHETALFVSSGTAVYVPTGGNIPNGADTMVMIEQTHIEDDFVVICAKTEKNDNIIHIGDDAKKGQRILEKGKKITPFDVGILVAAGVFSVFVCAPLKFYIISTGDEIIEGDCASKSGQIRDVNGYVLDCLVREAGCLVVGRAIVSDDYAQIRAEVEKGLALADCVITTGGSSVGNKDYTLDVLRSFDASDVFVTGLNLKPGKPTLLAKIGDKPVFGLPGHPVSAVIVFKLVVNHYLSLLRAEKPNKTLFATLTKNVDTVQNKLTCQVVTVTAQNGRHTATPIYGKSGLISLLSMAGGYVKTPSNTEGLREGETVEVFLF